MKILTIYIYILSTKNKVYWGTKNLEIKHPICCVNNFFFSQSNIFICQKTWPPGARLFEDVTVFLK